MSRAADRWPGHPWAPDDGRHDPHGITRTWCSGCNEWCSPRVGCACCNEPAHEWLTAEARWWAADSRSGWHIETADGRTHKVAASLFPWEDPT